MIVSLNLSLLIPPLPQGSPAPGITGMVVTLFNTNPKPINNVLFQAAVPKVG